MGEVAAVNFRIIARAAAQRGIRRHELFQDASGRDDLLRGTRPMYPWSDYVAVMERLARLLGGYEELAAVAESMPSDLAEGALFESFVAPKVLYLFLYHVVNPRTFPAMRHECEDQRDGRLRISHAIDESCAPCLAFGWATLGGLRGLPRYLGLGAAHVESVALTGHHVTYLVTPPASKTLFARSTRGFPALVRALAARSSSTLRSSVHAPSTSAVLETSFGSAVTGIPRAQAFSAPERFGLARELRHSPSSSQALALEAANFEPRRRSEFGRRRVELKIDRRLGLAQTRWCLTPRHVEVLRGLVNGESNQELARSLGCSLRTIETHVTALLSRCDAPSRLSLVSAFWADL